MTKKFMDAAQSLSDLCLKLDEGLDIDEEITAEFSNALNDVVEAVERRKFFLAEIESKIKLAKRKRDEMRRAIDKFERIKERVIETTKFVIQENPDIPFKDSLGKKLFVMKNPRPSLKIGEGWEGSEYAKIVNKVELDKEKLKDDLIAGTKVEFAELEWGTQLRGLK
jgi:hypothetical protein